jgi:hypothetical protein
MPPFETLDLIYSKKISAQTPIYAGHQSLNQSQPLSFVFSIILFLFIFQKATTTAACPEESIDASDISMPFSQPRSVNSLFEMSDLLGNECSMQVGG